MLFKRNITTAFAVAAALTATLLGAQPAFASDDPLNQGELIVTPSHGTVTEAWTSLSTSDNNICPVDFRSRSFVYMYPVVEGVVVIGAGALTPGPSLRQSAGSPTPNGSFSGLLEVDPKINRKGMDAWTTVFQTSLAAPEINPGHIASGTWELRLVCQAGSSYVAATDAYYAVRVELAGTPGDLKRTWTVLPNEGGSSATATTTTVTGNATSATSATLLASVSPAEAAGTVQFQVNGADAGAPVTVSGGTASTSVSGIAAGSNVSISAVFTPDNAETYRASTGTGSVTTPPHATIDVPIGGEVPAETPATPTGLKLSVEGAGKPLAGTAERKEGQTWQATGALPNITVTDDDRKTDKWTLNGQVRDLTVSEGKPTIAAANLGWDPALVSAATGSVKGAKVDPNQDGGLGTAKALATGNGTTDANLTTVVNGGLTLNVPTGAPAGAYKTTLTLTLI